MQQQEAFDLLKMGKNVFLTGAAGSGKTYLLNKYIEYLKDCGVKVAITASTGIAATHLQGVTIHSWSGIGVRDGLSDKDLEKLLTNPRIKRNYKNKVLVIDEISMLHKHQLDMVDMAAKYILDSKEPFGGMQVIACGDFFQLPPVTSSPFSMEKQFAFEATAWKNADFHVCYLHEQHRQGNDPLINVLNDIRGGTAGEHTKVPLRTRYKKEPEGAVKATKLYSRNINVDAINEQELANINSPEKIFTMAEQGWGAIVEGLKKTCLAPQQLRLKNGAEVMFIKNDTLGRFVNGTRGVVTGFDREGWPVVTTYDNDNITAYPEEWKYEENGVVRATISQVPLRLAWAITIHKSQGMTLDAAEMDLGDAFEPGMGYVALSRVRRLDGLKLMNLNEMALKVHPGILEQDKVFKNDSAKLVEYLQAIDEEEKIKIQYKTLTERFKGYKSKENYSLYNDVSNLNEKKVKPEKQKPVATHIKTLEMLKDKLPIEEIAQNRNLTDRTILSHIEKLHGLKLLDDSILASLKEKVPAEDFDIILEEFKQSADGKLTPVFEKFAGKYPYVTLQIVRLFVAL